MMSFAGWLMLAASAGPPPKPKVACTAASGALALSVDDPEDAVVRLVELLVDKRALGPEELAHFLDGEELTNPLAVVKGLSEAEALPYRCAFEDRAAQLKDRPAAWARIRDRLRNGTLGRVTAEGATRAQAAGGTKGIVVPIARARLPPKYNATADHFPMTSRVAWDGREYLAVPVKGGIVLYDTATGEQTFHAVPTKAVRGELAFIMRNGVPCFAYNNWSGQLFNLNTGKRETKWFGGDTGFSEGIAVVTAGDGLFAVTVAKEGTAGVGQENKGHMTFYDLKKAGLRSTVSIPGGSYHPVTTQVIDDVPYLATVNYEGNRLVLVDGAQKKVHKSIPINGYGMAMENYRAEFVGRRVIVPAIDHFVVADVKTGKVEHAKLPMPERMQHRTGVVKLGEAGAAYAAEKKVYVLDLEKGAVARTFESPHETESNPAGFEYRGKQYVAWGGSDGNVMIGNMETGEVVASQVASGRVREVVPFVREGRVMAMVVGAGGTVGVVQLAGAP